MTKKDLKKWAAAWAKAGMALDKIKQEELISYDYQKNIKIIDSLLNYACQNAEPRLTSGLLEQQRLFKKISR